MHDTGFDQNRASQSRVRGHLQSELEGRVASPFGLDIGCRHADRRERLDAAGGEPLDKRREPEISDRVDIHRLDAVAGRRKEPFGRAGLGPSFDRGARPGQQTPADRVAGFA
ncbi:MAG TPA: hypothetical protein VKG22_06145 [Stellaceae bacterium]|nr:hypothetical protein [Stellaceae bacterium]